jgi:hypothetical protein
MHVMGIVTNTENVNPNARIEEEAIGNLDMFKRRLVALILGRWAPRRGVLVSSGNGAVDGVGRSS